MKFIHYYPLLIIEESTRRLERKSLNCFRNFHSITSYPPRQSGSYSFRLTMPNFEILIPRDTGISGALQRA
jgi:hypothetical protein